MAKETTITCNLQVEMIVKGTHYLTAEEVAEGLKGFLSKFDDAVVSDVKVFVNDREESK